MPNAKKSFLVNYRDTSVEGICSSSIAKLDDVVKACSLALNIHQFSNVAHKITVVSEDSVDVILSLELKSI